MNRRPGRRLLILKLEVKSKAQPMSLGLRLRKMNIHNMNNARRIMLDYNDIMVESTGQELHEVLVPKVARFMYIKQHPTLRTV